MKKIVIVGCGNRGQAYSSILKKLDGSQAQVVAVADPREYHRNYIADQWNLPENMRFNYYQDVLKAGKIADAVIVSVNDDLHTDAAIGFANQGYDILLEKPVAPSWEQCKMIEEAVKRNHVSLTVCHVLRYTPYVNKIKELLDGGAIGDLVTIQHIESVVYWHQAHSFVRGNWRNSKETSCMLLAKSCHDIDLFQYFVGRKCLKASSFGNLYLFNKEHQPAGAANRCLDCPHAIESQCEYSALKIYWRDRAEKGNWGWPVDIVTNGRDKDALMKDLREGPYGRCVYACDNDVVDHQVVNLEFEGGITVNFTMTAFTPLQGERVTRFCGTKGHLYGDGKKLTLYKYIDNSETDVPITALSGDILSGHGGGDAGIILSWLKKLDDKTSADRSGIETALESHRVVFAAEQSRLENKTILL